MSEPFRTNFFGEQIAQPSCTGADFFDMVADRYATTEIFSVSIYADDDLAFRYGGEIIMDGDVILNFDGFDSVEACGEWVETQLNFYDAEIVS